MLNVRLKCGCYNMCLGDKYSQQKVLVNKSVWVHTYMFMCVGV